MLNPNIPEFLPRNPEVLREISNQAKANKLHQQMAESIHQEKVWNDLFITNFHIESQIFQETENVYQMYLICYTNHFKNYSCQTDLHNGFSSSDEENLTPTDFSQWFEAQEFTDFPYNQPYFEGYNYQTGFSSSDDENLTPTESVQWFEHQEVIQIDHQVTEGWYNPYYQNRVYNV